MEEILREFTLSVARLTVVDDPDGLFAEAGVVEALRRRGFEVVSLDDRAAFRFFCGSRHRSRRGRGDVAETGVPGVAAGGRPRPGLGWGGRRTSAVRHGSQQELIE